MNEDERRRFADEIFQRVERRVIVIGGPALIALFFTMYAILSTGRQGPEGPRGPEGRPANAEEVIAELVKGDHLASLNYSIPKGVIVMWSGSRDSIPNGWVLCDGSFGTPDLRDKFVVSIGTKYKPGDEGGKSTNTWIQTEERSGVDGKYDVSNFYTADGKQILGNNNAVDVENRPPYFALAFIMKQ